MSLLRSDAKAPLPSFNFLDNHLVRSPPPSSQSVASSAASPGTASPDAWTANLWTRGTPDTSPPSSGSGSPDLKPSQQLNDAGPLCMKPSLNLAQEAGHVKSICFIGAGFVGGPTAAVIAYHNPHILVHVVDLNEQRVAAWNSRHLPIHEEGLLKVVRTARDGTVDTTVSLPGLGRLVQLEARQPNLVFSTRVVEAISEAQIIFICVNTPTKTHGLGAGSMADVSAIESATRTVAKHARGSIIVEKSTVPCGTARMIQDILRYHRPESKFEVLSNPEFLAEGTAVRDLMHPDRILIGSAQTRSGRRAASILGDVYAAWVPDERIVTVNTFSSELAKLVANAMLAQRISSINAVSAMCEEIGLGADVEDVGLAIGKDNRLGPMFLKAGVGFGGSCFEKDILSLAYLANELHLEVVAEYWLSILKINEHQRQRFANNVVRGLNGSLRGKKIAVLGFAFKDGTNDTRNSIAVHIIRDLAEEVPREIAIFDPGCAIDDILEEARSAKMEKDLLERITICSGWRDAVRGASAVCILTPWKHFRGYQAMSPKRAAQGTSNVSKGSLSLSICEDRLTEMKVMVLEDLVRQEISLPEDPLGRLTPLAPCPSACLQCGVDNARECDADAVDWTEVAGMMQEPRLVFDGRNVVDAVQLERLGFRVRAVGKGP